MTTNLQNCPIWDVPLEGRINLSRNSSTWKVPNSPRAGGGYRLSSDAWPEGLTPEERARLTTWLVDQRELGNPTPEITSGAIESAKNRRPLPVDERAYRLLRLFARSIDKVGNTLSIAAEYLSEEYLSEEYLDLFDLFAWTESLEWSEIRYFCQFLVDAGLVTARIGWASIDQCEITVKGYKHIADQATNTDSTQAFVAMWFAPEMDEVYKEGIELGIQDAGFKPYRVDREEHIDKIDDVIIAGIRKSRFLVADFTQDGDNARGGVYYEAGFAQGLGLPVVFTCRKDCIEKVHFDTNHYNHIVWTQPGELRRMLANRIVSVLGPGPLMNR